MSQMTRSGIGAAMSATTSMVPSPSSAFRRACGEHVVDDLLHGADELLEHPRRERLRHDPPDLGVPRVVHADQRAVELVEVGRHVRDRHRALARAEDRRLGADRLEVGVPGDRVVAGARLQHRHLGLGEERERPLAAQQVEHRVPLGRRPHPELPVGQVDGVQVERQRAGGGVHGHGGPPGITVNGDSASTLETRGVMHNTRARSHGDEKGPVTDGDRALSS